MPLALATLREYHGVVAVGAVYAHSCWVPESGEASLEASGVEESDLAQPYDFEINFDIGLGRSQVAEETRCYDAVVAAVDVDVDVDAEVDVEVDVDVGVEGH